MPKVGATTQRKSFPVYGFKAVDGAPPGTFEAVVSVFGNVDLAGEVVVAGAFKASLARWASSGDPIPVIFSHQWDNLDAHVGIVTDAKELLPGDPMLAGTPIANNGGLWVKMALDTEEDFAGRLATKMARRSIKEFSFAYDVLNAKPSSTAGAKLDLLELDIIEVGPTLKGMNPTTELLTAKASRFRAKELADLDVLELLELADDIVAQAVEETEKRLPGNMDLGGAVEATLGIVREAATVWAGLEYGRDLYAVHLEATYLEDGRALVTAERWEDPYGEGPLWELSFELAGDGTAAITDARELELTVSIAEKRAERLELEKTNAARLLKASSAPSLAGGIVPATSEGKAEDRESGKADDQRTPPGPLATMLEVESLAAGL